MSGGESRTDGGVSGGESRTDCGVSGGESRTDCGSQQPQRTAYDAYSLHAYSLHSSAYSVHACTLQPTRLLPTLYSLQRLQPTQPQRLQPTRLQPTIYSLHSTTAYSLTPTVDTPVVGRGGLRLAGRESKNRKRQACSQPPRRVPSPPCALHLLSASLHPPLACLKHPLALSRRGTSRRLPAPSKPSGVPLRG